jgi:hypothetical protein
MTVRSVPIFLQAGSHPAEETRLMLGGMLGTVTGSFAGGVASSDPAHGVVRSGDFAVTQNGTPNMSVNVAAGGAFIRGTQNANQGAYHVWNDGTVNLGIDSSDLTNGRRDLVIAQVRDSYYSGATDDARITVVTGTPAASPVDPSLSSFPNALVLARITVAAGDSAINTADITDLRPLANQAGKLPVFTSSALASTAIPSPYDGQAYYQNTGTETETVLYWNGTAWRQPWAMPWGEVGHASLTTAPAFVTTRANTGLSITTGTIPSNRVLKHTVTGMVLFESVNDMARLAIVTGSSGGSSIMQADYFPFSGSTSTAYTVSFTYYETTGSTAALTRRITQERSVGSGGGVKLFCDANRPATYIIEDIGPSGAPA